MDALHLGLQLLNLVALLLDLVALLLDLAALLLNLVALRKWRSRCSASSIQHPQETPKKRKQELSD